MQHPPHKNAARRRRRFRARGWLARRPHRTRGRRARWRHAGCDDDNGVSAAHQRAVARSTQARYNTPSPFASMARDDPRGAAARRYAATRFGTQPSRETAPIPTNYPLARFWEDATWCIDAPMTLLFYRSQNHRPRQIDKGTSGAGSRL